MNQTPAVGQYQPPPLPSSQARGASRRAFPMVSLFILLLFAAIIFAERYYTRWEPLSRDEPAYAVVANEMSHGRALYSDVFDQKPPAVYLTFMAAEDLTGYNRRTIYYIGLFAALVSLLGVYLVGKALTGRETYGLWAAGFWTLVCSDLYLQANQPNTEVFMNAALIWALVLMFRRSKVVMSLGDACGAGLLFAWATLYKPVTVMDPACLLAAYVLFPPGGSVQRRAALARAGVCAVVIGLVWAGVVNFFAAEGHWQAFYNAMVVYNKAYAGSLKGNIRHALSPGMIMPRYLRFCLPLALLSLAGLAIGLGRQSRAAWLWIAAFAIGTFISISLPGKFFPHYYQLWLPLIAVAPCLALASIADAYPRHGRWLPPVLGALAALTLAVHEAPDYRLTPDQWALRKFPTEGFVQAPKVAAELNHRLGPGESFYDAGTEPELYLETQRRPLSGIFYADATTQGPFIVPFTQRVLRDLNRTRPEIVVVRKFSPVNPAIWAWIRANYHPTAPMPGVTIFRIWVRNDDRTSVRHNGHSFGDG